jgi:O-antigen/teichoic acid export membrane protein
MQVINSRVDSLMLGAMQGTDQVGIYSAAIRGADLITFGLIAANATLAPTIAGLFSQGELKRLQRVLTGSARLVLLFTLVVGTVLIVFGQWFLALFGPEFVAGYTALVILSVGRIINAATGSVATVLVMTGYERTVALAVGLGSVLNIVLNFLLIPSYGMNGAALASSASMILWNVVLVIVAMREVGLNTTAFRFRSRESQDS